VQLQFLFTLQIPTNSIEYKHAERRRPNHFSLHVAITYVQSTSVHR